MKDEFRLKQQKIKALRQLLKAYKKSKNVDMVVRIKTIIAYLSGKPIIKIAEYFDVSEKTMKRWVVKYLTDGTDGLEIKERSGRPPKLDQQSLKEVISKVKEDHERVWVARHICGLILIMFSVIYSVKYLPALLTKMGLSFHKAVHYLVKRKEEKRAQWIKEKLPAIYAEHIKQGWRIFFQDEVGFQTEGTLAYTWGARGKAIIVNNKGRHGRVNLMGVYNQQFQYVYIGICDPLVLPGI